MAIVTKGNEGNEPMADDAASGGGEELRRREEPDREDQAPEYKPTPPQRTGFFRIYKPGQGYWTRLGTVIGVGLIIALTANFIYKELDSFVGPGTKTNWPLSVILGSVGAFVVALGLVAWHDLNKPSVVDFLIATESEMKKVNWTSRKELIGSTKVVIVFMLLIALVLFLFDLVFGWFFYGIRVLHQPPF